MISMISYVRESVAFLSIIIEYATRLLLQMCAERFRQRTLPRDLRKNGNISNVGRELLCNCAYVRVS